MYRLTFYLNFLLLFSSCSCVFAQQKGKESQNPFQMVKVPANVKSELEQFYLEKYSLDKISAGINVYNLLDRSNYKFGDGIYTFRLMGPHFTRRIFIYNKGKAVILRGSNTSSVLEEYLDFLKTAELEESVEIRYLQAITKFLQEEYEAEIK